MLILSRKVGESLLIGEEIEVKITEVSGDRIKIGIVAPRDYKIMRKELCQTVESNVAAADSPLSREDVRGLLAVLQGGEGPIGAGLPKPGKAKPGPAGEKQPPSAH